MRRGLLGIVCVLMLCGIAFADHHVVVHKDQGIGTFIASVDGITIASTDGVVDIDQGELSLASNIMVTNRGFEFVGSNIVVSAFRIFVNDQMVLEATHETAAAPEGRRPGGRR